MSYPCSDRPRTRLGGNCRRPPRFVVPLFSVHLRVKVPREGHSGIDLINEGDSESKE